MKDIEIIVNDVLPLKTTDTQSVGFVCGFTEARRLMRKALESKALSLPQDPRLIDRMTGFVQHLIGCEARSITQGAQPCSCGLRNLMSEYREAQKAKGEV